MSPFTDWQEWSRHVRNLWFADSLVWILMLDYRKKHKMSVLWWKSFCSFVLKLRSRIRINWSACNQPQQFCVRNFFSKEVCSIEQRWTTMIFERFLCADRSTAEIEYHLYYNFGHLYAWCETSEFGHLSRSPGQLKFPSLRIKFRRILWFASYVKLVWRFYLSMHDLRALTYEWQNRVIRAKS